MEKTNEKSFLTIEDAAKYLNVKKSTLYKWTHQRKVDYYRPNGKQVYFTKVDLDAFLGRIRIKSNDTIAAESIANDMKKGACR